MDIGQEMLLDLDGIEMFMEDQSFVKFEASGCKPSPERPHGLRYSLTYHAAGGTRLIGFDNAHGVQVIRRKTRQRGVVALDHRHRWPGDPGVPYRYSNATKLLEDFWKAVERAGELWK